MKRSADSARFAFGIHTIGGRERFRVHLDDAAQRRAAAVHGVDAREVLRDQRP